MKKMKFKVNSAELREHGLEVRPCPFCGNEDIDFVTKDGAKCKITVVCRKCKTRFGLDVPDGSEIGNRALLRWNRRVEEIQHDQEDDDADFIAWMRR